MNSEFLSRKAWGPSIGYNTGSYVAVALDDNGNAVEVHAVVAQRGANSLFYRIGKIDFADQRIAWGPSIQYDTGYNNAAALDGNGNAVEVGPQSQAGPPKISPGIQISGRAPKSRATRR